VFKSDLFERLIVNPYNDRPGFWVSIVILIFTVVMQLWLIVAKRRKFGRPEKLSYLTGVRNPAMVFFAIVASILSSEQSMWSSTPAYTKDLYIISIILMAVCLILILRYAYNWRQEFRKFNDTSNVSLLILALYVIADLTVILDCLRLITLPDLAAWYATRGMMLFFGIGIILMLAVAISAPLLHYYDRSRADPSD